MNARHSPPINAPAHEVTMRQVDSLVPYGNNARSHTETQVEQIAASIREFGWTNPLIIHGDTVVAGHARLAAARQLGMTEVPVIDRSDMTEEQWRAYVLADNRLAENASWDDGLLRVELGTLADMDIDLDVIGFGDELAMFLDDTPEFNVVTEAEQGDLDSLAEQMVACPHCGETFDARANADD